MSDTLSKRHKLCIKNTIQTGLVVDPMGILKTDSLRIETDEPSR